MGNSNSDEEKKGKKAQEVTELKDVHRKCVKTFCGNPSEDVNNFVQQLETVKHFYNLNDKLLLELTLEKIDGKALAWLHSNPGLMTYGHQHFKRVLLAEFSKKKPENAVKKAPPAPSAPPKVAKSHASTANNSNIYPPLIDSESFFDHTPPPPSYETIMKETVVPAKNAAMQSDSKLKQKRLHNRRQERPNPTTNAHHDNNNHHQQKPHPNTGTKPKILLLCDFCEEYGHDENKCLLKAAKEKSEIKCNYCKAEGHSIKDCRKLAACQKCGEKGHKTDNCQKDVQTTPSSLILPLMDLNLNQPETTVEQKVCNYCKNEGHFIRDCPKITRCRKCGDKNHRLLDCPLTVKTDNVADVDPTLAKLLMDLKRGAVLGEATTADNTKICRYCKAEGHNIRDCKKIPPCQKCGERKHKTQDCPLAKTPLGDGFLSLETENPENGFCHKCKEIGHHTVECQQKNRNNNARRPRSKSAVKK